MKWALAATLSAAVSLCMASLAAASDQFRADAKVVLINATVLDRHDRPIRGLTRQHFRVFEGQAEQSIAYFSEEETPLSLAVIFDVSGSMQGKIAQMRATVDAVLKGANAQDEFSLITFADRPQFAAGWRTNAEELQNRLLLASAHGPTALLDALAAGLAQMKGARNPRKALLVLSDGGDNHSRASEREVLRSLEETGVQIYAVDSAGPSVFRTRSPEEFTEPDLLERLCDSAGGRYFQVDGKRELEAAAEQISRELRWQYVIGYVPAGSANDGRFHHVRVQVKPAEGTPKVTVFWRRGYRAAGD